jgi:hypothetical protein
VTAGYHQLEELQRILSCVPRGVEKVSLRSDSAGYQIDLMKYCASGANERFGVIDFGISCEVCEEFKKAVRRVPEKEWRPLRKEKYEGRAREWAEVAYTSNGLSYSQKAPEIRFFATREIFRQYKPVEDKAQTGPVQRELDFEMDELYIEELESGHKAMKKLHLTLMSGKIYTRYSGWRAT